MPGSEPDHPAQEALVHLPEDISGEHRELVGAIRVVEVLQDLQRPIVEDDVGAKWPLAEMEEPGL